MQVHDELQFPFGGAGFNPPHMKQLHLQKHTPWKTTCGAMLLFAGSGLEFFSPVLGAIVQAFGVVLVGLGIVHAMARLQLVAVRLSVRGCAYKFSFMPPLLIAGGAVNAALGLLFRGLGLFFTASSFLVVLGGMMAVLGWRWWSAQITTAAGG